MSKKTDPDWDELIVQLTSWVLTRHEPPDFGFAHIQAPPAIGKSVHLPHDLLWDIAYRDVTIYNVVPKFKKEAISKEFKELIDDMNEEATAEGKVVTSKVKTVTYEELLHKLESCRDRGAWNDLTKKAFRSSALILIHVDLDFSAEFLLALNAAVVFTATYAEQNPKASMRLATMSWGPFHPFIEGLYRLWDDTITNNPPPPSKDSHEFNHIRVERVNKGGILETLKAYVTHLGSDQKHTILRFDDMGLIPDEWTDDAWVNAWGQTSVPHSLSQVGDLRFPGSFHTMLSAPTRWRLVTKMLAAGTVHIIPSQVRQRVVFDRMTGQAVQVAIKMSISDRQEQMIWPRRVDIEQSQVFVYTFDEYLVPQQSDPPRRMDAVNQQLGGFVAALANFGKWPVKTMDMLHLFGSDERTAIGEMTRRFQLQGLLQASVENSIIRFGLTLPPGVHDLFFKLLPEVRYDSRIAHFLVLPSTPRLVQVKSQTAALLLIGHANMAKIDWSIQGYDEDDGLERIRCLAASGRTSNIAAHGTLWSKLGLMKSTWAKHNNGMCDVDSAFNMVDGRVTISKPACESWTAHHKRLCKQLKWAGIAFEPMKDVFAEPHDI
ncbi:hypothetical protein FSARC_7921 [Fusarium sarcochroum]|uniref:Uncharacterized protein n=1 Tax=Fusarium sarcochroum TaxID=1208366 RepID=A0A8H4TUF6_9HYPO|nr:hypothetical protein FSARC_7921 [Fusarium sarcochroum]